VDGPHRTTAVGPLRAGSSKASAVLGPETPYLLAKAIFGVKVCVMGVGMQEKKIHGAATRSSSLNGRDIRQIAYNRRSSWGLLLVVTLRASVQNILEIVLRFVGDLVWEPLSGAPHGDASRYRS
jgi:hypothetical protein